jgi:glycosyltransferase involved in cell wall biosynthesis
VLIRAFNKAFRRERPRGSHLQVRELRSGRRPRRDVASLGLDAGGGRVIFSENDYLPYYQLASLYRSADCFVLPTRGEGWGMPILEAMACGLPVIASYWSGQQSFMTEANSYPLQVGLRAAEAKCPYYVGFRWAEPDEQHLVRLLRHVFDHPDEARAKGERAADDVKKLWNTRTTALRVRRRLVEVTGRGAERKIEAIHEPRRRVAIDVCRAVGHQSPASAAMSLRSCAECRAFPMPARRNTCCCRASGRMFIRIPATARLRESGSRPLHRVPRAHAGILFGGYGRPRRLARPLHVECVAAGRRGAFADGGLRPHVPHALAVPHAGEHSPVQRQFRAGSARGRAFLRDLGEHPPGPDPALRRCRREVSLIYCGVDHSEYFPRPEAEVRALRERHRLPDRFFLFVGSLEPRKNIGTAIAALARCLPTRAS